MDEEVASVKWLNQHLDAAGVPIDNNVFIRLGYLISERNEYRDRLHDLEHRLAEKYLNEK